jgi:mannosyl-oligosaccharide alpha-1,2-mannosidase
MGFRRYFMMALAASCSLDVLGQTVQMPNLILPPCAAGNKSAVVKLFNDSYTAYKKYAWGHDDLSPVSLSYTDGRNGWGASIADALGTMYIMNLTNLFHEAVNFTSTIDFSKSQTNDTVSVFETTIRYVGGFLSAYELSGEKFPILVEKAKEVADKMAFAWVNNNTMPYNLVNFTTNEPVVDITNIAQVGTLSMEWGTLSKHTGNDTYRQLAEKAVKAVIAVPDPLLGLPAQDIDPTTGKSVDGYVTWGGGSDSYFEYLIKYPRLTNTNDTSFVTAWKTAVDTSIKELLRTSTVGNFLYLADYDDDKKIRHVGSHLACFYGGNWLLGGKLLNNQTIVDYGLQLTDACWNTYQSTVTGIGPETFAFESSDGSYTGGDPPDPEDIAFYEEHGFYITGSDYILRPEVLESNFYAWRVSGDTKYLDRAAAAIDSFNEFLPATVAFAGIDDVNSADSTKIDDMESFWFAEVLKYLYLTFDDPTHISLDEWVFNTECHPLKAPAPKSSYPTGTYVRPTTPFKAQSGKGPAISPNPFLPVPLLTLLNIP